MSSMEAASPGRRALVLVDIQPDFMPGGALPVEEGDEILSGVRDLMESGRFDPMVATQDWHPPGHVSFASSHPGREPFEAIELYGHDQVLWPDHCVQGTAGAELHSNLPWEKVATTIQKGTDPAVDSYSGFRNNWNANGARPPTGLADYMKDRGVDEVVVCGLARDFCAKWTAEDAADEGFDVTFIWDLTRPVDPSSDDAVREELEAKGVRVIAALELEP